MKRRSFGSKGETKVVVVVVVVRGVLVANATSGSVGHCLDREKIKRKKTKQNKKNGEIEKQKSMKMNLKENERSIRRDAGRIYRGAVSIRDRD